jgi:hypothetical protein
MENTRSQDEKKAPFQSLFNELDHVIALCRKKMDCERAKNNVRQRWAEILVKAAACYGGLYEKSALEDLENRIRVLEQQQKTAQNA